MSSKRSPVCQTNKQNKTIVETWPYSSVATPWSTNNRRYYSCNSVPFLVTCNVPYRNSFFSFSDPFLSDPIFTFIGKRITRADLSDKNSASVCSVSLDGPRIFWRWRIVSSILQSIRCSCKWGDWSHKSRDGAARTSPPPLHPML